ncbi:resolvase domain [Alistipes sp. CAG:157]|nr:resolvase domain [Alistipes sp. CAG:157]
MGDSFSRLVFSGQGGSWKIGTLRKFLKMQRQLQDNLQVAFVRYRTLRRGSFWRKERDSNPRYSYPYTAFRVRPVRPLRHLSLVSQTNECLLTGYKSNNNLQINHPVEKIASLICRIVRRERTCGCRRAVYRAAVSVADRSIFSYLATLYDSVLQQWENFSINSGRGITCGNFRS